MDLSVVICTWNRAALLRQTLERMRALQVPAGVTWEVLVVNNACSDDTDAVLATFAELLPVRRLYEPQPGKSYALNRAVAEARGAYLVFTDDDVLVEPDWLAAYLAAFARHPEAAVFGGPIRPWFEGTPPEWLVRTFDRVQFAYAALDLGPTPRQFGGHDLPFGANLAIRTADHRRYRYDTTLGPRPGRALRGEETVLVGRMLADGATGWWVPEARVLHFVPAARQNTRYLDHWYHGWGEYVAAVLPSPASANGQRSVGRLRLLGRPLWLWREMIESRVRYAVRRRLSPPEVWIEDLKQAATARGRFASL
jgi:glycosyltransferase involved in cell wall biosynthesis